MRAQRGFSLIEVLLAFFLLALVLISVATLFPLGQREVKSGRTASEALALARTILEEMEGWGFGQIYNQYGYDGTASSYLVDTRSNSYASRWQATLDNELDNSYATIHLESLASGGSPPPLASTRAIRVTITVRWEEGQRGRRIELSGVRM